MIRKSLVMVALAFWIGQVGLSRARADDATGGYTVKEQLKVGGEGGFDYVTLDAEGKLLYLTRTTHTQVVDTATGKVVGDIPDNAGSHGVALAPEQNRGFISNGKDATIQIFDLKTYETLGKIKAADDCDAIIYDPASKHVLALCGDAHQLVAVPADIDPKNGKAEVVELGGKPEYAVADGEGKVFVALVEDHVIAVVDTMAMKVIAKWPVAPAKRPVGMSMDRAGKRIYVGCRSKNMVVMSAEDGKILASLPIGAGVDGTNFYDGTGFASCSDGTLSAVRETSPGKFEVVQTLKTLPRAKTLAIDQKTGLIYLPTMDGKGTPEKPPTFIVLVVAPAEKK